jgi:hypothetical protein
MMTQSATRALVLAGEARGVQEVFVAKTCFFSKNIHAMRSKNIRGKNSFLDHVDVLPV